MQTLITDGVTAIEGMATAAGTLGVAVIAVFAVVAMVGLIRRFMRG